MSSVDAVSAEGVHIAGGALFGGLGIILLLMRMVMGFTLVHFTFPANMGSGYTYLNGGSDWSQKSKLLVKVVRLIHLTTVLLNGAQKILLLMLVLSFVEMAALSCEPPAILKITFNTDANEYNEMPQPTNGEAPLEVIHFKAVFEGLDGWSVVNRRGWRWYLCRCCRNARKY